MNMTVDELRKNMNECGSLKVPFLFAVDFEMSEGLFIKNPEEQHEVYFRTPLGGNRAEPTSSSGTRPLLNFSPISYEEYEKRFAVVQSGLMGGDSFLVNLSVKTPVTTTLSMEEIFQRSSALYNLYIPGRLVCFSPERFVLIKDGKIRTNPMKGTIDAKIPDAERVILANNKEIAEHYTVVDLLRNDIGIVAKKVCVERFRYIDRIKTREKEILQVSSEITGELPDDYLTRLGDIVLPMLPAGSVSGAPKRSTLDIIRRAEGEKRGFYTGVFGFFDGEALDCGVLIRYIEKEADGNLFFRSGGGITIHSNARDEYNEILEKIYLPFL